MLDPRCIVEVSPGANYIIPTYFVTNDGIQDGPEQAIDFCKGNKEDETVLRQSGVFVESLIEVAKRRLEAVNVPPLATRETAMAITKLDEALMWLGKRSDDRRRREVEGTYRS